MSRHRIVRNMNIAEELDDEAISDGGDDEISQEDHERLEEGLERIRNTLGSEAQSGITDHDIKDALWNSYYDIEASLNLILEEQNKRIAAQERKDKPLPQLPVEAAEFITQPHRVIPPMHALTLDDEGSHVIRLDVDGDEEFYYEVEQEGQEPFRTLKKPSLTTISERSERTEDSYEWAQYTSLNPGQGASSRLSWGSTTDYGQIIERPSVLDPNTIPPSPTPSALQRLSIPEPPPSASSTGSRTPIAQLIPLPDGDFDEEATTPKMHLRGLDDVPQGRESSKDSKGKTRSKLSSLASSRSNLSSHTSGTYTIDSGSVATYPPLRPSSQSNISLLTESSGTGASSMSSHVRRALETALQMEAMDALSPSPPINDPSAKRPSAPVPEGPSTSSGTSAGPVRSRPTSKLSQLAHTRSVETVPPSSTSSQSAHKPVSASPKVSQRADDATRRLSSANPGASVPTPSVSRPLSKLSQLAQTKGQQGSATPPRGESTASSDSTLPSTVRPSSKLSQRIQAKAAQAGPSQSQTDLSSVSSQSPAGARPTSKLAQLAQARAQQSTAHTPPLDTIVSKTADPLLSQTAPAKPSKLAQLAQAKAFQSQQSHWMPPKRTAPAPQPGLTVHKSHTEYLTPIANGATATTAITTTYQSLSDLGRPNRTEPATRSMHMFAPKHQKSKQSKLAMKSKRAQKSAEPEPEPVVVPLDPIFLPTSPHSVAPPSAFASVLVHDELPPEDNKSSKSRESKDGSRSHKHRSSRHHEVPLPPVSLVPVQTFAFDVPSPDDIVFNARRTTTLGQRPSKRPSPAVSASPSRASVASVSTLRV